MDTLKRSWWLVGLGVAALVVIVLAPLASADPDRLESVAENQGWIATAQDALYSIIPDSRGSWSRSSASCIDTWASSARRRAG